MKETPLVRDTNHPQISGYDYGKAESAHSPLSLEELRQLEQSVGWNEEDARVLQSHAEIFRTRAEQMAGYIPILPVR